MTSTILIVDDHRLVREGVRTLLDSQPGLTVVGEACDGIDAAELAAELAPDLIIMDICMPRLGGIEATRRVTTTDGHGKVLMLTMLEGRSYIEEALRAGAAGYVVKDATAGELIAAIAALNAGDCPLPSAFTQQLINSIPRVSGARPGIGSSLTERELEVLQLIAEGYSSREIAARIDRSPKTVLTHRMNLMQKLGIHKISGLVRFAIRAGVVTP